MNRMPREFYGQIVLRNNGVVTGFVSRRNLAGRRFIGVCVFNAAGEGQHLKIFQPGDISRFHILDRQTCLDICRREHLAAYHL